MNNRFDSDISPSLALELFQLKPNILYSLDTAAYLAGVPSRSVVQVLCDMSLCRRMGSWLSRQRRCIPFRRIEHVRTMHGLDLALLKTMFDLL